MVNSSSYDDSNSQQQQHQQTQDRNAKAGFKHTQNASSDSKRSPAHCNNGFSETADSDLPTDAFAIEPTPTKTEFNSDMSQENHSDVEKNKEKLQLLSTHDDSNASICCSVPLDKVQGVLTPFHQPKSEEETPKSKLTRKLLCLYCDRSFVSANLRQKHVERIHSVRQIRRVSSRRQNQLTVTPCVYCDKLNSTENTLKDLFQHLVSKHSNKYFGCLPCEERFITSSHLTDHNTTKHALPPPQPPSTLDASPSSSSKTTVISPERETIADKEVPIKVTRSRMKPKQESCLSHSDKVKKLLTKKKAVKLKELRNKKLSVKSSRITIKRRESKRIQAITKQAESQKKKTTKTSEKKLVAVKPKPEQTNSTNSTEKLTKTVPTCINPYPEFDSFYRVKKITDHSIDNLKISSLTFDDVFDKAFFNRIRCNIEENLLHHIDGKLFKNEESESRISNFEKTSNMPQEAQSSASENYGCEISLNAVTPVASLSLNSQFGEDFESQIEYGSKPSKKKTQTKTDEIVHYKYFTRRKFQASILEHKENRDLSKLDMWTQLVIKKRQQKMLDEKKSVKEMQEYTAGDEYKNRIRREELNRILDRRGPFEDLKEEASKKVALDKLNSASEDNISHESFSEVREVLNEILNRVFEETEFVENSVEEVVEPTVSVRVDFREIPEYLNLRRSSSLPSDEIDRSDKITLICSSQETENFELPTNQVRGKDESVELSGEWARCRMYICAACGAKLPNMKYLLEHKSLYHQNVWVQHYEFVGNQNELYRHLSIPILGKVGAVEESVPCKVWKRSDARVCTKCGKQCNSLGELHRHILECGGDWTWMLARKKCRYRPFGAKSRRKRRGLVHRVHVKRKTEPTEKKKYKKPFEGPRQRPSDADSIQRMLANLPAKRSTRKLISLHEGIHRSRKKTQINATLNKNKVKCGKMIYKSSNIKETTEKTINTTRVKLTNSSSKNSNSTNRRTLRSLNKVLASRIIDSNPKITVKRKLRVINHKRRTRRSKILRPEDTDEVPKSEDRTPDEGSSPKSKSRKDNSGDVPSQKRCSPRSQDKMKKMTMKKLLIGKINIKSFFPIKKRKNRKAEEEPEKEPESAPDDILTRRKTNQEIGEASKVENTDAVKEEAKKMKRPTFSKLVRSLSMKNNKLKKQNEQIKDAKHRDHAGKVAKEKTLDSGNTVEENTNKKRKLKQSFRNVINRVKKLKIDSESPTCSTTTRTEPIKFAEEQQTCRRDTFLDKTKQNDKLDPRAQPEKIVIPSTLEAKENLADISETAPIVMRFTESEEDLQIPERIFKLESNNEKSLQAKGELNFDTKPEIRPHIGVEKEHLLTQTSEIQPITIETSVKPKAVPMVSPNMKGKIRKPARGLNDCIAMLTSKLQQKTEEQVEGDVKKSKMHHLQSGNVFRPLTQAFVPKSDCILKIPSFKTHFTDVEETALDLSMKSQSNPELSKKSSVPPIRPPNFLFPIDFSKSLWIPPTSVLKRSSIDQTIEEVIEKGYRQVTKTSLTKWNSVDEIIQTVIDGYKYTPMDAKQLKTLENLRSRNTIDDIIDFVVGGGIKEIENNVTRANLEFGPLPELVKSNPAVEPAKKLSDTIKCHELHESHKEIESALLGGKVEDQNLVKPPEKSSPCKKVKVNRKPRVKLAENLIPVATDQPVTDSQNTVASTNNDDETNVGVVKETEDNLNDKIQTVDIHEIPIHSSEPPKLDTAFVDASSEEITGKPKRSRKLVRKNSLKKKTTKGKILETNVDDLLNFEEVAKPETSTTNLGTVTSSQVQEPDIRLRSEDEPHVLENKVLLVKNKPVIPSDSEDDIPLSALIQVDQPVKKLDSEEVNEQVAVETDTATPGENTHQICDQLIEKLPVEEEDKEEAGILENKDKEIVASGAKDSVEELIPQGDTETHSSITLCEKLNQEVVDTLENEKKVPKSIESHEIETKVQEDNVVPAVETQLHEDNITPAIDDVPNVVDDSLGEKPREISENSLDEPLPKFVINNTYAAVFKTPKKLKKPKRKQIVRKRSLCRSIKIKEIPKRSKSLGDISTTENAEPDTDDESLLSIKMSLELSRNAPDAIENVDVILKQDTIDEKTNNSNEDLSSSHQENVTSVSPPSSGNCLPETSPLKLAEDENNCSISTDKTDSNSFFDSGISDESLENLEHKDKSAIFPKRRVKKTNKISLSTNNSSAVTPTTETIESIAEEADKSSENFLPKQDNKSYRRSARSITKRNSEMDLSDSSSSIFDISIEDTTGMVNHLDRLPFSSSPKLNSENISDTKDIEAADLIAEVPRPPSATSSKVDITPDFAVVINNKKQIDELIQNKETEKILLKMKSANSKKIKSKQKRRMVNNKPGNNLETDLAEAENIKDASFDSAAENETTNSEASAEVNELQPNETTDNTVDKIVKRSKSLRSTKTTPIKAKRSSSTSSLKLSKPKDPADTTNSKSAEKSRSSLRQIKKSNSPVANPKNNSKSPSGSPEKVPAGRKSRSVRSKVINYAENDDGEITDSATPPEGPSPESSPTKTSEVTEKILPDKAKKMLEMPTSELPNEENEPENVNNIEMPSNEADIVEDTAAVNILGARLRNRKVKRKSLLLKKHQNKNNNKLSKKVAKKSLIPKNSIESHDVPLENSSSEVLDPPTTAGILDEKSEPVESDDNIPASSNDMQEPVLEKSDPVPENGDVIKEPPIKIIINKHKTRRKSKSFRKLDNKGQNDLFKDFSLVIKKPKRLAPVMTFTPNDGILKGPYPNLVTVLSEPKLTSKPTEKSPEDNLVESVEEMDMELDETPITSDIIERNSLQEVEDTSTTEDVKDDDVRTAAARVKSRKTKNKKSRIVKRGITAKPVMEEVKKDRDLQNNEISTDLTKEINLFNASVKTNLLEPLVDDLESKNSFGDKENSFETDILNNDDKVDSVTDTDFTSETFTIENNEVSSEKPVLRIRRTTTTKRKTKKGRNNNKIEASKSKDFNEDKAEVFDTSPVPEDINGTSLLVVSALETSDTNITDGSIDVKEKMENLTSPVIKINISQILDDQYKENVYAFSETDDLELDIPLEISTNLSPNKPSSLSESNSSDSPVAAISKRSSRRKSVVPFDSLDTSKCSNFDSNLDEEASPVSSNRSLCDVESNSIDEVSTKKKKSKLPKEIVIETIDILKEGAIKENSGELEEGKRRKSARSAKVKALEHIHDEALAELTESERNRGLDTSKVLPNEEVDTNADGKKNTNKKVKKNHKIPNLLENAGDFPTKLPTAEKAPSFADLVADLAGLEELENSIERELNAEADNDLELSKNQNDDVSNSPEFGEQDNQELRRSRRGSRKIASYNENDLIDPLLDIIDRKKRNRKKDPNELKNKKLKEDVNQLNCDELFDMLKSSTNDNAASKLPNSFSGTINRTQEDTTVSDKFEAIFNNVSDCLNQLQNEKASGRVESVDSGKVYDFTESPDRTDQLTSFPLIGHKRKMSKTPLLLDENAAGNGDSFQETSEAESTQKLARATKKDANFCEICNKSFIRIENLIKHKKTLTHIQKLSEIEAKQAKEKSKNQIDSKNLIDEDSPTITCDSSRSDINIQNILLESEKPNEGLPQIIHSSFPNNDSLKLVDIISDVLNKPPLTNDNGDRAFIELQTTPELRRCKSLGERKSFNSTNMLAVKNDGLSLNEPYISKTTILEKQISLLENIIENQTGVNYIDDISISSNNSIIENTTFSSKQDDSSNFICKNKTVVLSNVDESFLKPTQYEEISEDSVNVRNYEDQKLRKTLNRDEELFLECCSLLKSGSEVSSYSNQRSQKVMNRLSLKQFDEPGSMEAKSLIQNPDYELENDFSDGNSRIPTPLGDSYDDDASDSNTISSNWDINKMEPVFENQPTVTANFNFQEVLNKAINRDKKDDICDIRKSPTDSDDDKPCEEIRKQENVDPDKKKIITKGARKVFEGLKVSIPTVELNLEEVLNCSPKCKKLELQVFQSASDDQSLLDTKNSTPKPSRNARKSKPVKKVQVGSNLLFKMKKKKTLLSPGSTANVQQDNDAKSIDVYDFEETQDNSDVFTKPDFRTFRSKVSSDNVLDPESDTESRDDYLEQFIAEPESITSSLSSSSPVKSKAQENITKKKCMIMGRIFKNQAKSKIEDIDEEMREIPIMGNEELVESYVANCNVVTNEVKPKLSETEINQLFDQLLENKDDDKEDDILAKTFKTKSECYSKDKDKKFVDGKKKRIKNKKRIRTNSESTDDEFNLNKSNKRVYRKNGKAEDNSINLEQELKECIGVASRKSQRKCTSGKQNVLVEYWSSDESQFEALLETQRIEQKPKHHQTKTPSETDAKPSEAVIVDKKIEESDFEKMPTILKPPPRPRPLKKPQIKKKHAGEKKDRDRSLHLGIAKESNRATDQVGVNRRKRAAANPLYHWSSSSEDESQDLIEVKPLREDEEFEDERPVQHGWIVGESPKKLVTMLAQAKGKKLTDTDCVKEQGKKRTNNSNS